jgi:hypothetical protein
MHTCPSCKNEARHCEPSLCFTSLIGLVQFIGCPFYSMNKEVEMVEGSLLGTCTGSWPE